MIRLSHVVMISVDASCFHTVHVNVSRVDILLWQPPVSVSPKVWAARYIIDAGGQTKQLVNVACPCLSAHRICISASGHRGPKALQSIPHRYFSTWVWKTLKDDINLGFSVAWPGCKE